MLTDQLVSVPRALTIVHAPVAVPPLVAAVSGVSTPVRAWVPNWNAEPLVVTEKPPAVRMAFAVVVSAWAAPGCKAVRATTEAAAIAILYRRTVVTPIFVIQELHTAVHGRSCRGTTFGPAGSGPGPVRARPGCKGDRGPSARWTRSPGRSPRTG